MLVKENSAAPCAPSGSSTKLPALPGFDVSEMRHPTSERELGATFCSLVWLIRVAVGALPENHDFEGLVLGPGEFELHAASASPKNRPRAIVPGTRTTLFTRCSFDKRSARLNERLLLDWLLMTRQPLATNKASSGEYRYREEGIVRAQEV